MSEQNKPKGMKKKSLGSVRARSGLPAKAGRRRPKHISKSENRYGDYETVSKPVDSRHETSEHDRKRGRMLSELGVKFYHRPSGWLPDDLRITS